MKKIVKRFLCSLMALALLLPTFALFATAETFEQYTNLPTIYITLDNGKTVNNITKEDKLPGTLTLCDATYPIDNATITIKGRGNSTWTLPKKPYQINFSSKTDVLGMGSSKKWILLANYWDKTLMRNAVAYELANKMNNIFSVEWRFVDVIINGEYRGNYLLTEKIEFGGKRIDDDPADGAALFELEQLYRHASEGCAACFITDSGVHVTMKEPEEDEDFSVDTINQIKAEKCAILNTFEQSISKGYAEYSKLIDVQSFIDWYIQNELAKNYDAAFVTSSYCYLDSNDILHMGPLWDVDVCFGNQDVIYPDTIDNGLNYYNYRSDKGAWYDMLFEDADFAELVKARWAEIKEAGYLDEMLEKIDQLEVYLADSQEYETNMWPDAMQVSTVRDNPQFVDKAPVYYTFGEEVDYFKNWLVKRINWLDSQWNDDYDDTTGYYLAGTVTGNDIRSIGLGSVNSDNSWEWTYSSAFTKNSSRGFGRQFFEEKITDGEYILSVKFAYKNGFSHDGFMLNVVGINQDNTKSFFLKTPATKLTYEMSEKDTDGYATVSIKFNTEDYNYKSYYAVIDAYNANTVIKNATLYSTNQADIDNGESESTSSEVVKEDKHCLGDVNSDGDIASNDALSALQFAVGKVALFDYQKSACDVDCSDDITSADALQILQYSVKKIEEFDFSGLSGKTINIATQAMAKYQGYTGIPLLYKTKIKELNEKYGVSVKFTPDDRADIANNARNYNIVETGLTFGRSLAKNNIFYNIGNSALFTSRFDSGMTGSMTLGNNVFGIATDANSANPHGLLLNTTLLSRYAPNAYSKLADQFKNKTWTWDALTALVEEYKRNAPSGSIIIASNTNIIGEAIVSNAGYEVKFKEDNSGAISSIATPEGIKALKYVKSLKLNGYYTETPNVNTMLNNFVSGNIPIVAYHLDALPLVTVGFGLSAVPFPIGPDQDDYVMSNFVGNSYSIPDTGKQTYNAEMFILRELATLDSDVEESIVDNAATIGFDKLGQDVFRWAANNTTPDHSSGAFTAAVGTPVDTSVLDDSLSLSDVDFIIGNAAQTIQNEVNAAYGKFYVK